MVLCLNGSVWSRYCFLLAPPWRRPFCVFYVAHAGETAAALILILVTLVVGALGRRVDAIVTSFVAALCLDVLFIPPIFKITIATPSGWVGLFVFLAAALFASSLSSALAPAAR